MNATPLITFQLIAACIFSVLATSSPAIAADQYALDPAHAAVVFRIEHLGMSYTYGRFNHVQGKTTVDAQNPSASSFSLTIKSDSIDTGLKKRDDHLRSPDFFNVKQFPVITFQSTAVHATDDGYRVTGDLLLHGVTKSVTVELTKMGQGDDPWGNYRIGFATELTIKRSDFGMTNMPEAVGDDVHLMISFEGLRQ